jgi:hypothetical protein
MSITSENPSSHRCSAIDIDRFASLKKLLRVTSIILAIVKWKTFRGICSKITSGASFEAEKGWVKHAQGELPEDYIKKFQRLGPFINQDGIVCVGQRIAEWIKQSWNQRKFFLLPRKGRFTELIVCSVHGEGHAGLEVTLAKIRSRYWIPEVRKIVRTALHVESRIR